MNVPVFNHLGLNCREPAITEEFYCRHFGFRRARVVPMLTGDLVFLRSGEFYLELFTAREEAPGPPPVKDGPEYAGFRHLAFRVDDLDAALRALGPATEVTLGPLDLGQYTPGWRVAWIKDPDGRIIELSQGYRDEYPVEPESAGSNHNYGSQADG